MEMRIMRVSRGNQAYLKLSAENLVECRLLSGLCERAKMVGANCELTCYGQRSDNDEFALLCALQRRTSDQAPDQKGANVEQQKPEGRATGEASQDSA